MKKIIAFMLITVMLISLLSGCTNQAQPEPKQEEQETSAQQAENTKPEGQKEEFPNYPKKTIKIIADVSPGGATDTSCRIIANYLQEELNRPVVVVNMNGGGGTVGDETVRTAKADGYTLLYTHTKLHTNYYSGKYEYSYNDFKPISTQSAVNETLCVDGNAPWNSLDDFVKDAKENPSKYIFGVQLGALSNFMAGALMDSADIDVKIVSAGHEAEKLAAMQGGNLHMIMASMGSAINYSEAGKMKVLAVAAEERDPLAPDFSTAVEQGYDVVFPAMHTLYGPKDLPDEIAQKLNDAFKKISENKEFNEKLQSIGQVYQWKSLEDTNAFLEKEHNLIKNVGEKLGYKK